MKCSKCNVDFLEKDIQESHDVPKYIGGTDLDGRHWLCKKCHDIYEKIKQQMRRSAKIFVDYYFTKEEENNERY
jgi:uncharacterized protein with PIN domain